MSSRYLLKPQRTLREACRDAQRPYPEMENLESDSCPHNDLCKIPDRIEHDRIGLLAKMETEPAAKRT